MTRLLALLTLTTCLAAAGYALAAGLPGDANDDGKVSLDDFVILKQNFGTSDGATSATGDFDGDGDVDLGDFVILKQNFGRVAPSETIELPIAASADDAIATASALYTDLDYLYWPDVTNSYRGFLRWAVNIPAGSTITAAHVSMKAHVSMSGSAEARMQLLDADDCADFSVNPYSRPVTDGYVDWVSDAWTSQQWYDSPNISELVQQFVNRPGYAPGAYMGLRAASYTTNQRKRVTAFDCDPAGAARLTITYSCVPVLTADAGPDQTVIDADVDGSETVTLDGSASRYTGGTIAGYQWNRNTATIATGATPSVTLPIGEHTITLTVTGDDNATDEDTVVITVAEAIPAGEYYLDPGTGSDTNAGSVGNPWQTFAHAQAVLAAGDTLYCTGELGPVTMTAADPAGSADQPIAYRRWPNMPSPHIQQLLFDGTVKDAHLIFEGFRFDPGYVATAGLTSNNAVNLDGASYITFSHCEFEGPKLADATGDFAPYVPMEGTPPPTITAGNPGNASHITITDCTLGMSNVTIRMVEHAAYPDKRVRHWRVENNQFTEAAEDFITIGLSGDAVIAGNTMRIQNRFRSAIHWPGTATGTWPADYSYVKLTQDVTGASAMAYYLRNGRLYLLADDADHTPARNNTYIWRLDSDPANTYFTPSGTGDSTHGDCIAVQGATTNVLIARNWMETDPNGGQALKLDYVSGQPRYITVENNAFVCRTEAPTYLVLIQGGSDTVFRHNIIYPGPGAPLGRGIRFLTKTGGEWQNLQFHNNIISGAVVSSGTMLADHNCWLSTPPAAFTDGPASFTVAGLAGLGIVDPAGLDFHLLADSPARDTGDPAQTPGISATRPNGVDLDNLDRDSQPDIGPYEYRQ